MNQPQFTKNSLPKLTLDKNRRRVKQCPCGKSNKDGKFAPFIGYDNKGYCHACGKTFFPALKKDSQWNNFQTRKDAVGIQSKPTSYIDFGVLQASLKCYGSNNFVSFLIKHFGIQHTNILLAKYYIGTSRHWNNATVFWQVDQYKKIRTGKIMLYNPESGKRVKTPKDHVMWAHKMLRIPDFNLSQCLFGSHLLFEKDKPLAIVESEKTAIIASLYLPGFIWLATGGKNGCKWMAPDALNTFKGRKVILWPDANAFDLWSENALTLKKTGINIEVSELLEKKAAPQDKADGVDIADYLLNYPLHIFRPEILPEPP